MQKKQLSVFLTLSSRTLREAEMSLLKKGLNFAVTPASVPATKIITNVVSVVSHPICFALKSFKITKKTTRRKGKSPELRIRLLKRDETKIAMETVTEQLDGKVEKR